MKLIKDDGYSKAVDPVVYQSMVGSLIYAAIATRPDIAQAVGALAKFNPSPNQAHLTAVKRVFRYLKGTVKLHLSYEARDKVMGRYSDADWLRQSCKVCKYIVLVQSLFKGQSLKGQSLKGQSLKGQSQCLRTLFYTNSQNILILNSTLSEKRFRIKQSN